MGIIFFQFIIIVIIITIIIVVIIITILLLLLLLLLFIITVIEGATPRIVAHGKQRVDMVVWTNRFKEEPNYFISIPLNLPQLMERLETFKKEVTDTCGKVCVCARTHACTK